RQPQTDAGTDAETRHTREPAGLREVRPRDREWRDEQDDRECRRAEQVSLVVRARARARDVRRGPRCEQRERRGVASGYDRKGIGGGLRERSANPGAEYQCERHGGAVALLDQPAEKADREQRGKRVEAVRVGELAREEPPP